MKRLLIFDLDDTLLNTSDVYYRTREEFINYMSDSFSLDPKAVRQVFEDLDREHISLLGYPSWRYTFTMLKTYWSYIEQRKAVFSPISIEKIVNIGNKITLEIPPLLEGAKDVLVELSRSFTLALLTRGDFRLQKKKIKHYGLDAIFSTVMVVSAKTEASFLSILLTTGVLPEHAWSIGDSPKWDIFPALNVGMNAILFRYVHPFYEWKHEKRSMIVDNVPVIEDLRDLRNVLPV